MHILRPIIDLFQVDIQLGEITEWGSGHINSTYRIENEDPKGKDVILQRINTSVFKNVDALMQNYELVTNFIHDKKEFKNLVPALIPTINGKTWISEGNSAWRMIEFIEGRESFDIPRSTVDCYKAGLSYGSFLTALENFPVKNLKTTIPDFHNLRIRLHQLEEAIISTREERTSTSQAELEKIHAWSNRFTDYYGKASDSQVPVRVTHNDTKLNNVLLGEDEFGTVIDLDTVMPGFVGFDVGDAIRSMAISAAEDESELSKIRLLPDNREAFLDGYLTVSEKLLTKLELELLNESGAYMAFIMAVRFLTDYLNGDIYYKTKYNDHNLVRARNQLKVCELLAIDIH